MSTSQSGFLLGIGSNIEPYANIKQIIVLLLEHYPTLTVSRVVTLPPIGMNSQHEFLNLALFIETDTKEQDLKRICNQIEITLGRDRSDPARKTKDRPADLDILTQLHLPQDAERSAHSITDEYFLYPLIDELIAYLSNKPFELSQAGVTINIDNLTFGQTATTINRNARTGDERVI
jgi:2-amino-4-hydroxy-6-hydroxymethyldihydropteridine diphosphokinase